METKTKVFEYSLNVRGIFLRNRTSKFHTVKIWDGETRKTADELKECYERALARLKVKKGIVHLSEQEVEISMDDKGWQSRSFMLFSDVKLKEERINMPPKEVANG